MIEKIYTEALLAAAAYAEWDANITEIKAELINNRGFTETQFDKFFDPDDGLYEVYLGSSIGYTDESLSGFSATIFKNRSTDELTVAFRGTDGVIVDWLTTNLPVIFNGGLLGGGALNTLLGQDNSISEFLEQAGLDVNGMLTSDVNFTGHSLGGYLTTIAAYKYHATMGEAYTYNGLGISLNEFLSAEIINGISIDGKIDNYYADLVGAFVGIHPGTKTKIFIEEGGPIDNHSVSKLVESLSVYRILALIDASLDTESGLDEIYSILDAATHISEESLEDTIAQIGDLLGGDLPNNTGDIELFYQALLGENGELKPDYQGLSIDPLTTIVGEEVLSIPAETLKLAAENSIAYRYALVHLNSFVVTGNDELYNENHNNNHELDLYNPETDEGTLTEIYLIDRSNFLELKITHALTDTEGPEDSNAYYEDKKTGLIITEIDAIESFKENYSNYIFGKDGTDSFGGGKKDDHLYGGGGNDLVTGGRGNDYIEGNKGIDTLRGDEGHDILVGGEGDDTLIGGTIDLVTPKDDNTQDVLMGGKGNDTYHIGLGDIIIDSDGQGVIMKDGQIIDISNLTPITEDSEFFSNNNENDPLMLKLLPDGTTLQVIGSYFEIHNFNNGDFGIDLSGQAIEPVIDHTIIGTNAGESLQPNPDGSQAGNIEIQGLGGDDFIDGGAGDDLLVGGTGDDNLDGNIGNDIIHGDEGDDVLLGFDGDDVLIGGDGNDRLNGEKDNDVLDGGAGRDLLIGFSDDDVLSGGLDDDFLAGGQQDDFLEGETGSDILAGGGGIDALFGGDGMDFLWGDKEAFVPDNNWVINVIDSTPGELGGITLDNNGSFLFIDSTEQDADLIRGGAGDDFLFGEGGNDQLYGDEGSDELHGEEDDDYLDGGAGDDFILGGSGNDVLFGGADNDELQGGDGDDELNGDEGNDRLFGYAGNDVLNGGTGNDELQGGVGNDNINGDEGDDLIFGEAGDDVINGGSGADSIDGGTGLDTISGGDGDDVLLGRTGDDVLDGGAGDDHIEGNFGNDTILAGEGIDFVNGGSGDDFIDGGAGNDIVLAGLGGNDEIHGGDGDDQQIQGNAGNDLLFGEAGNDILFGQTGDDVLDGGVGNDQLQGGTGFDQLFGGDGDDLMFGQDDDDLLDGGAGLDDLQGGNGNDTISGGNEQDLLFGQAGDDFLDGGEGDDQLLGDIGNDTLIGGAGNDRMDGDNGADILQGGDGNDTIFGDDGFAGGDGNDVLHGGRGNDQLTGDGGDDTYLFNIGDGQDIIFEQGDSLGDFIVLGEGIDPNDTFISREGSNLIITHSHDPQDRLTVANWFNGAGNKVDHIEFADGTIWDQATIEANVNLLPTANPDTVNGNEDSNIFIAGSTLTANDTDPDNDPLNVIQVSNAVNGTAVLDVDGNVVFTPDQDFFGTAFFDYTMSDGRGGFDTATVTVNVANVNDAPVANPDTAELTLNPVDPDQPLEIVGGNEIPVSTPEGVLQRFSNIAVLNNDTYVISWVHDNSSVRAQRFDLDGNKIGSEFLVSSNIQPQNINYQSITSLSGGGFVITWDTNLINGDNDAGIAGQLFDSQGNKVGNEFLINTHTSGIQSNAEITTLTGGGFIVTWNSLDPNTGDNSESGVSGQLFDSLGSKVGSEFLVNTLTIGTQGSANIAALDNGGFIVTWISEDPATGDTDGFGIAAQLFDMDGNKVGNEILVNTITSGQQTQPDIVELDNGNFVVVWNTNNPFTNDWNIAGQIFDHNGTKIGDEFIVNTLTNQIQVTPSIASLDDGNFLVTWTTNTNPDGIGAQLFDIDGNKLGDEFLINENFNGDNSISEIASLPSGGFVASWNKSIDVYTRVFSFEQAANNEIVMDVLANDTDVDSDDNPTNFSLDSATIQVDPGEEVRGEVSIVNNQLVFDAGSDFDYLNEGETAEVIVDYTMSDDEGLPSSSTVTVTINGINDAPVVVNPIHNQSADEDALFSFTVPADVFSDPDNGDSIVSYAATLADDSPLPAWLGFDPNTLTFSGTPLNDDVGTLNIKVTATDTVNNTGSDTFTLTVNNTNDAPELQNHIPDQSADVDTSFSFAVPADTFLDIDVGDTLTYSATLTNGDPLPAWLSFDPVTQQFSGTPTINDQGTISVEVKATDGSGEPVMDTFDLTVNIISLIGDDGDNILNGTEVSELIDGRAGNDTLNGGGGDDLLLGGNGDDVVNGDAGNDILDGSSGNDILTGGDGDDTYLFGEGGGNDIIVETDTATGGDVLRFADNISAADVEIIRNRKDLTFTIKSTGESITLQQWKAGKGAYPITVEFGDGSVLTSDDLDIKQKVGDEGNNTMRGSRVSDRLYGLAGDDTFIAKDGDDLLDGGAGNDLLQGMSGNDTYQFNSGWGNDVIIENDIENDPSSGNTDTVAFGSGLLPLDLMFSQSGDNLIVSNIGSTDTIAIQDWFLGSEFQTETFRASDGSSLDNTQVDQLIQAMAAFSADTGMDWNTAAQQQPEEVQTILLTAWNPA